MQNSSNCYGFQQSKRNTNCYLYPSPKTRLSVCVRVCMYLYFCLKPWALFRHWSIRLCFMQWYRKYIWRVVGLTVRLISLSEVCCGARSRSIPLSYCRFLWNSCNKHHRDILGSSEKHHRAANIRICILLIQKQLTNRLDNKLEFLEPSNEQTS